MTSNNRPDDVAQDPKFPAISTSRQVIGVPLCATTTSRSFRADEVKKMPPAKKRRHARSTDGSRMTAASDSDEREDIKFLISDDEDDVLLKGKHLDRLSVLYVFYTPEYPKPIL